MREIRPPGMPEMPEHTFENYAAQIQKMITLAREWVDANPQATPKISWNYPQGVMVIGLMQDAMEKKLVSCNDDGRRLLEHIGAFDPSVSCPSVSMCRFAMELFDDERVNRVPEMKCPSCGYVMDTAACLSKEKRKPQPGDFSICAKCADITIFTKTGIRAAEDADIERAKKGGHWEILEKGQAIIKAYNLSKKRD
jgi:hypothetical protein